MRNLKFDKTTKKKKENLKTNETREKKAVSNSELKLSASRKSLEKLTFLIAAARS